MATAFFRGHLIQFDHAEQIWRFADTRQAADIERPCVHCGLLAEPSGPDPCLGRLPGVTAACCGHGHPERAYVQRVSA